MVSHALGEFTEAELRKFVKELEGNTAQGKTKYTLEECCERYLERREHNKEAARTIITDSGATARLRAPT